MRGSPRPGRKRRRSRLAPSRRAAKAEVIYKAVAVVEVVALRRALLTWGRCLCYGEASHAEGACTEAYQCDN